MRVHDIDGIPWHKAPAPPRRHEHTTQTWGFLNDRFGIVERCPCGAVRTTGHDWALIAPDVVRVAPRRTLRQIIAGLAGRK